MKLRNKKTGEIINSGDIYRIVSYDKYQDRINKEYEYNSLAELNEEWEDVGEDKRYWYIDVDGEVKSKEMAWFNQQQDDIGNRFETKEEAEKAVEKLKAWKRLKDKGFKIDFVIGLDDGGYGYFEANWWELKGDFTDLKTIFWGEQ